MKTKSLTKVTLLSIFIMSVVTAVTLNSCQKEGLKPKAANSSSKTSSTLDPFLSSSKLFDEVSGLVFNASKNQKGLVVNLNGVDSSGCAVITHDTVKPYTTTYNYGSGCIGSDGIMRAGIVTYSYDNTDIRVVNNVCTFTFQNYNFNGWTINGSVLLTNTGLNTNGNLVLTQTASYVGASGGVTDTINENYSYEWIAGVNSNPFSDLQFNITGSSWGASSNGQTASSTITSTLTKNCKTPGCNYYIAGTVSTVVPDPTQCNTKNYSTPGGCSGQVSVTQNGVTSIQNQ